MSDLVDSQILANRARAEAARVAVEAIETSLSDTVTAAETATTNANTATGLANTATTNANTATTNANNAATAASAYSAQYIVGKNIFDKSEVVEDSFVNSGNGSIQTGVADWARTGRIPVSPETQYTVSGLPASGKAYRFEDADNVLISFSSSSSASFSFTTPADCAFVILTIKRDSDADNRDTIQVESGSLATSYEAYTLYARTIAENEIVSDNVIKNNIRISSETLLTQANADVRVWVADDLETWYVRRSLNSTKDVIDSWRFTGGNDLPQPYRTIIVDKSLADSQSAYDAGTYLSSTSDDIAPFQLDEHGAFGSNHGLNLPYVNVVSHDKTSDDLGSIWSDGTREWYLIEITSATRLTFYAKKYAGTYGDLIVDNIGSTTLTHVSGGTNTATINATSLADPEVFTINKANVTKLFIDNVEITVGGVYSGSLLKIVNTQTLVDPRNITVQNPFDYVDGDTFVEKYISYQYDKTGALIFGEVLNFVVDSAYRIDYYSQLQPQRYAPVGLSLTKTLMYIPRVTTVSGINLATTPTNVITPLGTTLTYTSANVPDPTKPPNRAVQIFTTAGDVKTYGIAYGFNPSKGSTKDSVRSSQNEYWELRGSSAKSYPRALNDYNGLDQVWHGCFYRVAFDSTLNPNFTAVYCVPDGNGYLLFIDVHETVTKKQVIIPDYLQGLSITVVDNKDMTLHTSDIVPSSGLSVSFDVSDGYGYLILRLA